MKAASHRNTRLNAASALTLLSTILLSMSRLLHQTHNVLPLRPPCVLHNQRRIRPPSCRAGTECLQLLFCMHYTREQMEQVVPGNSSAALITISVTYLTLLKFYINPTRKHILIHRPKIHYLSALLISLSMLQSKLWTWHRKKRFSSQGAHLCYASVL